MMNRLIGFTRDNTSHHVNIKMRAAMQPKNLPNKQHLLMKYATTNLIPLYVLLFIIFLSACKDKKYPDPLSPEASLATFDIHEDFVVELFAAEPHIWDPVDLVFDEDGNAYAVEMPDYPYKPEEGKGKGRIKRLLDTDGDGTIDRSSVFAEGLPDATSLFPWKGGLLVTSAPHIYYLKDTNGDGKADVKEVLFSGFFDNNSEAQITNLRLGVDNWIYAANNGQPGEVTPGKRPDATPLNMRGADFRFRLDKDAFELESGTAQFGQTLDDWGNKFFTQNTLHIQQAVIPRRYLERHGYLSSMSVNQNISDHDFAMHQLTPPPYWRAERTRRRNIQFQEQNLERVEHADKYFTGASGGTYYHGDAFPEAFYGNIFTGDVAGNLVHRDILVADKEKPTFIAQRAPEENNREFLASTDPWFRPVGFTVGPDGYLYMIDFYRQHIETPVSIPDDLKEEMDFMYGENHGRIYRIRPKNETEKRDLNVNLSELKPTEWVNLLSHQNGWWRSTAQRLLLENPGSVDVPALKAMATEEKDEKARLHALYLLETLGALEEDMVKKALESEHKGLQRNALMLAENFPSLEAVIAAKTKAPDAQVALQAVLSLGQYDNQNTADNFAALLQEKGEDRWFRTAVLSSKAGSDLRILQSLQKNHDFFEHEADWKSAFIKDIACILGTKGEKSEISQLVSMVTASDEQSNTNWKASGLEGLTSGLKHHEESNPRLKAFLSALDTSERNANDRLKELLTVL
ncbi:PVC-type heme-binding CxxCH protein [Negadavirga shengliensis]|uniref:PVC-type heme-binding CxxCH protein n=1 Tax=Negadavirga shengliensis TaxID=1389218 RepID=A0ABV9SX99_9BACT